MDYKASFISPIKKKQSETYQILYWSSVGICHGHLQNNNPTPDVDRIHEKFELGHLVNEGRSFKDEAKKGRRSLLVETFVLSGEGKSVLS